MLHFALDSGVPLSLSLSLSLAPPFSIIEKKGEEVLKKRTAAIWSVRSWSDGGAEWRPVFVPFTSLFWDGPSLFVTVFHIVGPRTVSPRTWAFSNVLQNMGSFRSNKKIDTQISFRNFYRVGFDTQRVMLKILRQHARACKERIVDCDWTCVPIETLQKNATKSNPPPLTKKPNRFDNYVGTYVFS